MSLEKNKNEFDESLKPFYEVARKWAYDANHSHTVWLKRSLLALGVLSLLLFMSLLLNVFLFPLKQKVPYLYAFNNATGEVTRLGELESTKLTENWAMTRYFLTQYVLNREGYNSDNLDYPYQVAWSMSDDPIRKTYASEVRTDNPQSPYMLYGKDKYIRVDVKSISKLNDNTAEIRFEKTLLDKATQTGSTSHRVAIIKWSYKKPETTQRMLDQDPLGFKVTYYEVTQINTDQ